MQRAQSFYKKTLCITWRNEPRGWFCCLKLPKVVFLTNQIIEKLFNDFLIFCCEL